MRSCRTASIVAFGALFLAGAIGACRESSPHVNVPPVTSARPSGLPILSGPATAASLASATSGPAAQAPSAPALEVVFLEGTKTLEAPVCSRLFLVAAKGTAAAGTDTLATGDVLVLLHPEPIEVKVSGLVVQVVQTFDCNVLSRPRVVKTLVKASAAPELRWAGGAMKAHLDVGAQVSPDLYLGRLEGTAGVAEHEHTTSAETLIAIEAAGTFTVGGKESRLGPRQVVTVPKGIRHAWKPDLGSKLVAIQIYEPPGPEQRFIALSQDAGTFEAGKR